MLLKLQCVARLSIQQACYHMINNNPESYHYLRQFLLTTNTPVFVSFYNNCNNKRMASGGEGVTVWYQREVTLKSRSRGCHYISDEILKACGEELNKIKVGVAHIHIKHTSASIILNENFDPTVLKDMEMVLNKVVPETLNYKHTMEGPDDMPAHAKAAMMGSNLSIPITNGKFNLGTWQGVWLCEHRDCGGSRKLIVTMNGLKK